MALDPRNFEIPNLLARVEAGRKSFPEAEAYYKRALELNPRHIGSIVGMVTALLDERRYDDARGYVERLRRIDPKHPQIAVFESWIAKEEPKTKRRN